MNDETVVHLALPYTGEILPLGTIPAIQCGSRSAVQWCGLRERVTCPKCLELTKNRPAK